MTANRFVNRSELIGILVLAVFLVVILPLCLDVFRLNLVAKYLTYAFVALGLVICWGYGGILSLGQGVFFGLGGYCMAMFLKLEASSPENTKIQSTPGIPDFMDWNQITSLPMFWKPFHSLTFTIAAVILVPGIFALIIGAAMFKRRVGGTYFAIITQAVAAILTILIVGQQGYTGGINGMTDLRTLKGWDIRPDHAKIVLYFFEVALLFGCIFIAQFIRHSKLGRILVAMREKEDRVRFSGYSVANFKIFAFCIAAMFAAIGGAMFALNVGFMSPSFVGIVPSIEMVIYTAVGGRLSILGAVYGKTKATSGSIHFRDKDLTKMKENQIVQAGVGRKFQTPSIYDDLTVFENLEISFPRGRTVFGSLTFTRDAVVRDRVHEVAEMIFLKDRLHMSAELLSHGQKQWLEIGMLLIQDPDLLMLDEPVAGMSVSERAKTAELLNRIIKNRSVLVIEHDMKFVEDIAHKVTVLHQGQILSEGTMEKVQNDPKVIEVYLGH